jgi:hypothetical protein
VIVTAIVVGFVLAGLVVFYVLSYPNAMIESHERASRPACGERVRFLCAIPEQSIEAGELGRVAMIYPGDDLEFWIAPDRNTAKRIKFFEYELWQIERVDG